MDIYLAALEARRAQLCKISKSNTRRAYHTYNMGLIRDGIGKALGAGQVQTGFNGPKLPFTNNNKSTASSSTSASDYPRRLPPRPDDQSYIRDPRDSLGAPYNDPYSRRTPSPGFDQGYGYDDGRSSSRYSEFQDAPPAYEAQNGYSNIYNPGPPSRYDDSSKPYSQYNNYTEQSRDGRMTNTYAQPYDNPRSSYYDQGCAQDSRSMPSRGFRPLALPQIEYGDGKPFLRGYSDELRQYGIEEKEFIPLLDQVNKAVIPNPENVIFQKAANIAGWFV